MTRIPSQQSMAIRWVSYGSHQRMWVDYLHMGILADADLAAFNNPFFNQALHKHMRYLTLLHLAMLFS